MDPSEQHARMRRRDMEAAAAAHRLARECTRGTRAPRPPVLLRLYARLWWASRPRAAAWAPGLFDAPRRT